MVNKLLITLLFITSCGKQVNLKANKLESADLLTNSNAAKYEKNGVFNSINQTVTYNGTSYKVSRFSSQSSFNFINSIPGNTQVTVIFTGGIKDNEVVLETIRKK